MRFKFMKRIRRTVSHNEWLKLKRKRQPKCVNVKDRSTKVKELSEYLGSLPWDFFLTGSTGYELTTKSGRRLAQRFYDKLPEGSLLFHVAEKFETKDGCHIHSLLKLGAGSIGTDLQGVKVLGHLWQLATGNKCIENDDDGIRWEIWNRIDRKPYMKGVGANSYCAKYINKKHGDYDILTKVTDENEVDYNLLRYPQVRRPEDHRYRVRINRELLITTRYNV